MRRLRLLLGIGMLATVLTVGVVACDDDEDTNGDDATAVPTEPADNGDVGDETPADDQAADETPAE